MATYGNMIITTAGQTLYAKVQSGTALTFTRLQIGGGEVSTQLTTALVSGTAYTSLAVGALPVAIASGDTIQIGSGSSTQTVTASAASAQGATSISVNSFTANANYAVGSLVIDYTYVLAMTALVTPISYVTINSIADNSGTAQVNALFQNTSLTSSTYTCEIGLFAQDPQAGEILYAYANAGANGDTIPPYADGPFSRQFQINIAVGSATSVTANIPAGTYVLASDLGVTVASLTSGQVPVSQLGNATRSLASARNTELTTTAATQIFTFTPTTSGIYRVISYLRVITAATNITLTIAYADSGGAQSYTPAALNATSISVGSHSVIDYTFEAVAGTAITLTVTAGTANQVFVSGVLEEVA